MDNRLLDILCCPGSKQSLARLGSAELALINQAIAAGTVVRADGSPQAEALAEGLITRDRRTVYRIDDGIPVLLVDEALATSQVTDFPR